LGLGGTRDPEVDHARPVVCQQHVRRLQVTMHDSRSMNRGQAFRQPCRQCKHGLGWQWPVLCHLLCQRRSWHVSRCQPRRRTLGIRVYYQRREQPAHFARRRHLAAEPGAEFWISGEFRPDYLHRDWPATC